MATGLDLAVSISTVWFDIFKAGIGAFFGALGAFGVNMLVQWLRKSDENLVSGNLALTVLSQQYGHFILSKAMFHEELSRILEQEPDLLLCLYGRPSITTIPETLSLDAKSLTFLLDLKQLDLVQELLKMDFRYHDFRRTLERVNEVAIERHEKFGDSLPMKNHEVLEKLGYALIGKSESVALAAMRRIDRDQQGYEAVGHALYTFMAGKYSTDKVVKFCAAGAEKRVESMRAAPLLWEVSKKKQSAFLALAKGSAPPR